MSTAQPTCQSHPANGAPRLAPTCPVAATNTVQGRPESSSATGDARAAFHTDGKSCIALHLSGLSGGKQLHFVEDINIPFLCFIQIQAKNLRCLKFPTQENRDMSYGELLGAGATVPVALGSSSEMLCQGPTKKVLQASEIRKHPTKQSTWQTGKFYPLNICSVLLLCSFIDQNVIQ